MKNLRKSMTVTVDFYNKGQKEYILCNLCGQDRAVVLTYKSVNDLRSPAVMCKNCGLIYLNPRLTREGYNHYYNEFYRVDRATIKQGTEDINSLFESSYRFGQALAHELSAFIKPGPMLDVGSSTGGVLRAMNESVPGVEPLGVEPSLDEVEFARQHGIATEHALFENWIEMPEGGGKFQTIMCLQTLNHLLDPRKFFMWSYEHLREGGMIVLSVKDWRFQVRRAGSLSAGVQIDHPYMFTPETLKRFLESVGFTIVHLDVDEGKSSRQLEFQRERGLNRHHIRIVGQKTVGVNVSPRSYGPRLYSRLRLALHPLSVKLWHLVWYSKRLRFAPWRR